MTAVGARVLARPDARVLGHAGARGTAFWNVTIAVAHLILERAVAADTGTMLRYH